MTFKKRTRVKGQDMKTGEFAYLDELIKDGFYPNEWVLPKNYEPPQPVGTPIRLPLEPIFNYSPPNFTDVYPILLGKLYNTTTGAAVNSPFTASLVRTLGHGIGSDPIPIVSSIQQVEITIPAGSNSQTATITSVDTSRTLLFYGGLRAQGNATFDQRFASVTFTNSTTLTAQTNTIDSSNSRTIKVTVFEYLSSAVSSIQYGTIAVSGNTATATISAIDPTRSAVVFLGQTTNTATIDQARGNCCLNLTNSTTVTATRGAANDNVSVNFAVIQYNASIISSVQEVTFSLTSSGVSAPITPINLDNVMLIYGGNYFINLSILNGPVTGQRNQTYGYMLDSSHIFGDTDPNPSTSIQKGLTITIVEFVTSIVKSNQNARTIVASTPSQDVTISSIDIAKSVPLYLGGTPGNTGTSATIYGTIKNSSATQFTINTEQTASTALMSWQITEFY